MSTFSRAASRYGLEIIRLPMTNGMWTSAERATCTTCGRTEDVIDSNKASHIPPEIVIKKLRQRGWVFRSKKATCPDCITPAQRVRLKPEPGHPTFVARAIDIPPGPSTYTEEITVPDIATLPEPRQPSREQKRRIHDEIQGNWDERACRYLGSASDQSIADTLHVTRAWVVEIRSDFFGDSGENADIAAFKTELTARIEEVGKLVENAMTSAARYDDLLKELKGMRSRLERIEKSVLPKR